MASQQAFEKVSLTIEADVLHRVRDRVEPGKLSAYTTLALRRQLERDGVLLDPVRAEVSYSGKTVELSRNELLILRILMENAGSIISRSELMDELWQTDAFVDDNTLTVNVNRLRRSLQSIDVPDDFIATRRGLGYVVR